MYVAPVHVFSISEQGSTNRRPATAIAATCGRPNPLSRYRAIILTISELRYDVPSTYVAALVSYGLASCTVRYRFLAIYICLQLSTGSCQVDQLHRDLTVCVLFCRRSHPTVGVAVCGSNISERLSSSREELPVITIRLLV